jgi:glutamate racemase
MSCVGMLDWGIGGLGCYRLWKRACPKVPVVYWSDTGAIAYGKLPRSELARRVQRVLDELVERGASHVLVACNAASTVLSEITPSVPTLGVIEAARFAVPRDLRGTLGVIGGARTVRSGLHRRLLTRRGLTVQSRVAQPLSGHIEAGTTGRPRYREDLARILSPLAEVDALLLACTHYPAIAGDIQALVGPRTRLLDPAQALIEQAAAHFALTPQRGQDRFLTTGSASEMRRAAERTWQITLPRCERVALR